MKPHNGFYIITAPDYSVSEETAMDLLRFLSDDMDAVQPQVQWSFHPSRSNLSVFVGVGLNGGTSCIVLEKSAIKSGFQVILNYYEGPKPKYTMVDLCYEPQSELLDLYARVSRVVHDANWKKCTITAEQSPFSQMIGVTPSSILTIGDFLHDTTRT